MYNKKFTIVVLIVVLSSLVLSAFELLVFQAFNQFMSKAGPLYFNFLENWPFLLIVALVLRMVLGVAVTGLQSYSVFTIQKKIYTEIVDRMRPKVVSVSDTNETSEVARKILLDVSNFTNGVLLSLTNVITETTIILVYVVFFIEASSTVFLSYSIIWLPILLVLAVSILWISRSLRGLGVQRQHLEKQRFFYPYILISSYIDVHSLGVFGNIKDAAIDNERKYRSLQTLASVLQNAPRFIIEAILLSGLVLVSFYNKSSDNFMFDPVVLLFLVVRLLPAFSKVISNVNSIRYYWSSAGTIHDMLRSSKIEKTAETTSLIGTGSEKGQIQISELAYEVNGEKKLVQAALRLGMINYISGKSGSGKTTLLKILSGLQKPLSGTVLFPNEETLNNIAYIPQEIEVIEGSIIENINFFRDAICDDSLRMALKVSGLVNVLSERNISLDTIITEGGRNLSGGQAQRLAIARSISRGPKVVVMDEALSGIHRGDAREILQSLLNSSEMFVILTTHDPQILDGLPVNEIKL